jgi:ATP:ADP antiporter, AAA family
MPLSLPRPGDRVIPRLPNQLQRLNRLAQVQPGEWPAVLWSFAYFFCLLCSYYVLRPVRDEMGIQAGVGNLPWLFTATFFAMLAVTPLFGWVSSRFPRRQFLPWVYLFFVANLLLFHVLFREKAALGLTTKAFFVWVSVFNLFVVSVFWSFMADLYDTHEARRLYGLIAAGGSLGAIAGPTLTTTLAMPLGPVNLLLISGGFLLGAVFCIERLGKWSLARITPGQPPRRDTAVGGGVLDGIKLVAGSPYLLGICLYVALYSMLSTFLYFQQQQIVKATIAFSEQRTALFAAMDLAVNSLTLALQLFVFSRFLRRFGLAAGLALIPLFSVAGFLALGFAPVLAVLIVFGVVRRAGEFAIAKPTRETLFNALSPDEKYKAKNFMDTAVYRAGDMASGWIFTGLQYAGLALAGISFLSAPLAAIWAGIGLWLARRHRLIAARSTELTVPGTAPTTEEKNA